MAHEATPWSGYRHPVLGFNLRDLDVATLDVRPEEAPFAQEVLRPRREV
jgi:hypothetical protein